MTKLKYVGVISVLILIGVLFSITGCKTEVSKAAYEKRVVGILKDVENKMKPNLEKLNKLPTNKKKEREALEKEQISILKEARNKLAKINPPDDFFSGHSNLVEFLDLFVDYRENQIKDARSAKPGAEDFEKKQKLQESYQMVTLAFTRASSELSFLQYEMRSAFYDLLRYQTQLGF